MDKKNTILQVKNLNKVFGEEVKTQVLFDLNLEISPGEFMSLIGPSGSGKSTFLNILGALERPTSGEIIFEGKNINLLNDKELAKFRNQYLGYIFQFHYLFPEFSALENVLLPRLINNPDKTPEVIKKAEKLLALVELSGFENRKINKLSGGQQQRVAIARSFINDPKIILADEPTGALDTVTSRAVMNLMREYNKESGTTFIIVTHDRNIAQNTDRIVELVDGKISKDFSPAEIGEAQAWKELERHACTDCDKIEE
jgi:lipoprotein-releasing system ATP-binding protein